MCKCAFMCACMCASVQVCMCVCVCSKCKCVGLFSEDLMVHFIAGVSLWGFSHLRGHSAQVFGHSHPRWVLSVFEWSLYRMRLTQSCTQSCTRSCTHLLTLSLCHFALSLYHFQLYHSHLIYSLRHPPGQLAHSH